MLIILIYNEILFLIQMLLEFCLCYFKLSVMCQDLRFCLSMWSVVLWSPFDLTFYLSLILNYISTTMKTILYLVLSSKSKLTFPLLVSLYFSSQIFSIFYAFI